MYIGSLIVQHHTMLKALASASWHSLHDSPRHGPEFSGHTSSSPHEKISARMDDLSFLLDVSASLNTPVIPTP